MSAGAMRVTPAQMRLAAVLVAENRDAAYVVTCAELLGDDPAVIAWAMGLVRSRRTKEKPESRKNGRPGRGR